MKRREGLRCLTWVFVALFLVPMGSAWAEEKPKADDFKEYTLGEIVVRGERPGVRDVGIVTEVFPEEFEATHSRTIPEALTYTPGVFVSTGRKYETEINIHGFKQDKVLILIDGVPYYETNFGKLDLNQVSTENVARIDVTKGAASVLYGANAEAGVINIITKKATEKPAFYASSEVGEKDAYRFALSHGMKKGIFNYWLSYTRRDLDALKLSDDFDPVMGEIRYKPGGMVNAVIEDGGNFRDNSDYKSDNFWAKVGIEPSEGSEYYVNFHYIATEKGYPPDIYDAQVFPMLPAFSRFARIEKYDDVGIDLSGRQKVTDKFSLQGKFFYHNHTDDYASYDDWTFTNQLAVSRYKDYILGGMLLGDFRPVEWDTLKFAFHYRGDSHRERDVKSFPFAESFAYTGSVGVENEFRFFQDRLSIVVGASYDWFEVDRAEANTDNGVICTGKVDREEPDTMDDFNPMAGASYRIDDKTRLFASVARKTRYPTLQQLYSSKGGNIDLEAEESVNYSLGISRRFNDILKVELSSFHYDISDRIDKTGPDPTDDYINYAEVKKTGFEVSAELISFEDLVLKAGYTYIRARDKSSGAVTTKVRNVPKHKVDVRASYTFPYLRTCFDLVMTYVGKSYAELPTFDDPGDPVVENDTYTFFNAKITQPFMKRFEAYLAVDNLFDKDCEPENGFPSVGRSVWLGLTFRY